MILDGEISASYSTGRGWDIPKPTATVKNNLAGLISGVSMGINSFVFAFNQRLMVGVGALGFAAGPYVDLLTTLTALKQSSATTFDCRQATFAVSARRRNWLQHAESCGHRDQRHTRTLRCQTDSVVGQHCRSSETGGVSGQERFDARLLCG